MISAGLTVMVTTILISAPRMGISQAGADDKQYRQKRRYFFHEGNLRAIMESKGLRFALIARVRKNTLQSLGHGFVRQ